MKKGITGVEVGILVLILLVVGIIQVPQVIGGGGEGFTLNLDVPSIPAPVLSSETLGQTDLRAPFSPLLAAFPNATVECVAGGGTWHWEEGWVGCEDSGPLDCTTTVVAAAMFQCTSLGANPVCSVSDVYCKY